MNRPLDSVLGPTQPESTETMKTPDDVAVMARLHALGWGVKRIAAELHVSRNTVRRHLRAGGWFPCAAPERPRLLDRHEAWLRMLFLHHRGNAAVVHEEVRRGLGLDVSLRTVQRACASHREELRAEAAATVRFETPPGRQLQVDFGQRHVSIAGERVAAHVCVLTLGYSRRIFAVAFACERQAQWLQGLEDGFRHFGGVPEELLVDNARALVSHHDPRTRAVAFNETFLRFCNHWGVRPRACAPYRARTKGNDERAVQYVARNAIAGRAFDCWDAFNAHLARWTRETADVRVHGTTGERPIDRFARAERACLKPLAGGAFLRVRELERRVQSDGCVEVDTNHYSVPWRHIRRRVVARICDGRARIFLRDALLADHPALPPSRARVVDPAHLDGLVRAPGQAPSSSEIARPLAAYEDAAGGAL